MIDNAVAGVVYSLQAMGESMLCLLRVTSPCMVCRSRSVGTHKAVSFAHTPTISQEELFHTMPSSSHFSGSPSATKTCSMRLHMLTTHILQYETRSMHHKLCLHGQHTGVVPGALQPCMHEEMAQL